MDVRVASFRPLLDRFRARLPFVLEMGVPIFGVLIAYLTYRLFSAQPGSERLLTPPLVALLLVANLLPWMALLVLVGRRIARRRAARSAVGGNGQLHVRLVTVFSVLASVPVLIVAIFASILFQSGVEFWFSDRARSLLENSQNLAQQSYAEMLSYVDNENVALSVDLSTALVKNRWPIEGNDFAKLYVVDVYQRSLSESVVFGVTPDGEIQTMAIVNPYDANLEKEINRDDLNKLNAGAKSVVRTSRERTQSITRIPNTNLLLYSARVSGAQQMADRMERTRTVLEDYRSLIARSKSLQVQFNAALMIGSLIIVGLAVFIALTVADRLVRPVGELVDAARRVEGGDLTARVPFSESPDEIGTLSTAFNQMTERLQQQTNALVGANIELESRRALIEAVMSGVSAGIISVDARRKVRLINSSAQAMLRTQESAVVGQPLEELAPELDAMVESGTREAIVQLGAAGEAKTLAVRMTRDERGHVLTFDDITQQLLDQRRAAWSDVARRIAHEIKNPLTPIQLAAERLQRRYGRQIEGEDGSVFARLTDTIVRQVGDLRRMVDEFSSFARMPKPVFREESLVDIGRQAMFLHEVARPEIKFELIHEDGPVPLVCDRRQLGQALTNIVKNAVEAVEARSGDVPPGKIRMTISCTSASGVMVELVDNGIGLPAERDRIVEPYMTTRSRGTGLGLAIVKKIVEEHFGSIQFDDAPGGGTIVLLNFDASLLAGLPGSEGQGSDEDERNQSKLTQIGMTRT